jgi:hypothetical protein
VAISHFLKFQAQAAIKPIQQAVCDRGYVGVKEVLGATIILPKKALKRDNCYQRDKKQLFSKTKK